MPGVCEAPNSGPAAQQSYFRTTHIIHMAECPGHYTTGCYSCKKCFLEAGETVQQVGYLPCTWLTLDLSLVSYMIPQPQPQSNS